MAEFPHRPEAEAGESRTRLGRQQADAALTSCESRGGIVLGDVPLVLAAGPIAIAAQRLPSSGSAPLSSMALAGRTTIPTAGR